MVFMSFCLHVSSVGGLILDKTVSDPNFAGMAVFTPVINGVGGNLVAVQASRISTFLHMNGMPGENSEQAPRRCPSPCTTFFSPGNNRFSTSRPIAALEERNSWGLGLRFCVGLCQLLQMVEPRPKVVFLGVGDQGGKDRDSRLSAAMGCGVVPPNRDLGLGLLSLSSSCFLP